MAYDFPNTPTIGQAFGNYVWDGEKWTLPKGVTPDRASIYAAPLDAMAYNGLQVNGSFSVNQQYGDDAPFVGNGLPCDGWHLGQAGTPLPNGYTSVTTGLSSGVGLGIPKAFASGVSVAQPALAATEHAIFYQWIEGTRIAKLAWGTPNAQPITMSFWTAHKRTGAYGVKIGNADSSRSYVFMYQQNVADTWEYKTAVIPGCTDGVWQVNNTPGMMVLFTIATGSNYMTNSPNAWIPGNYVATNLQANGVATTNEQFRVTGIVVLPGIDVPSAAKSPLIIRPYDQELITCQRYWQKNYAAFEATMGNPAQVTQVINLVPPMRVTPTLIYGTFDYKSNTDAVITVLINNPTTVVLQIGSLTAGRVCYYLPIYSDARI
jgi:hypothetical protein